MCKRNLCLAFLALMVALLSTGTEANGQHHDQENEQDTRHHLNHHHKHRHHHNALEDGDSVTSQEIDNDLLPSLDQDAEEEDEEVFYDDYSSRRDLFQLTDRDGDGYVTRDEYILQNGNITSVVDQVFMAYDGDGDGRFSEEEFLRQSSPLEVHEECEEQIIQTCDKLYLELKNNAPHVKEVDESACRAVQYLLDCVAGFKPSGCDIKSYANGVTSKAQSYRDSGACPLLYLHDLLDLGGEEKRTDGTKVRFARSVEDVEITTLSDKQLYSKQCPDSFIQRCSNRFDKAQVNSQQNYCRVLSDYRRCLGKRAKRCPGNMDDPLLRQSMAKLKKLQMNGAKFCGKK